MTERVNDLFLAAQFLAANGAVNDLIIRAGRGTACRHFVLADSLTFGMAKRVTVCSAANFAFSGVCARRGAAAVVCLVVDRVAAAAFMPMRGAVRCPLFGPVMAERFDLHIRRVIAAGTGIVGIPTDFGTRCRFCFVMLKIMTERINDFLLAAQFFAANGAVDDLIIRTNRGAACRYFVFADSLAFGMAKRVTVCNAANFTFSGVGTSCLAAAVVCLVVDLVAAAAFMPMRGAVRRPLDRKSVV